MPEADTTKGAQEIAFEAYGVRVVVDATEPQVLEGVRRLLPPDSQPCPPETAGCRFSVSRTTTGTYSVTRDGKQLTGTNDVHLELALELLDSQIRIYLGRTAPDTIFVHAGAVSHRGSVIVVPAMSFGGKTTLVAALVEAGAVYYSDEFAVLDREGLVIPYPKPLSVRNGGWQQTDRTVESYGGVAGEERLPVGMIVITTYQPQAEWSPKRVSAGAGAMALLANAVPARERSDEVMATVSRAAEGALVLEGERGEADALAPLLLSELERHISAE
jgi:hypothetical protein